jgi:hypothetical protein
MKNICKTCIHKPKNCNLHKYGCIHDPYGKIVYMIKCPDYVSRNVPWYALRFTYFNGFTETFTNVYNINTLQTLRHKNQKPVKVEVSAGGKFELANLKIIKNIILKHIKNSLQNYEDIVTYIHNSKQVLDII